MGIERISLLSRKQGYKAKKVNPGTEMDIRSVVQLLRSAKQSTEVRENECVLFSSALLCEFL